ncbi:reverse transcriptase domain-containing protein [Tanacetum coccineum]
MFTKFMNPNFASTSGSGSLPSNTVANLRGDTKAITTRSGVSYDGPQVSPSPSSLPKVVEHEPEVTKNTVHPSTENIQPPEVQTQIDEPVVAPKIKLTIPYPSRINKEKLREEHDVLTLKFMEMFRNLHFELSFVDALLHMPKFTPMFRKLLNNKDKIIDLIKTPMNENFPTVILKKFLEKLGDSTFSYNTIESVNRVNVIDVACEEFAQEVLRFSNISKSGNPTPTLEPILSISPPSLTPFEGGNFILEEIEACLTSKSIPLGIDDADFDPKEDLLTLERLLNSDPSSTLLPEEQRFEELKTGTDKLPVIIAKDLKDEDKTALLKVLRSHKRAIAWKILDIKGIDPKFCTHKILMEDNVKPTVQHQRRVNPKIHEVIKKEVIKLLDTGLIYPISDSPWVSPVHCVPKKGGITVIENDDNELIPTRLVTGWRVCIDYRKLNDATRKDHFPLPFMDQMLERLAGNEYYCFLDGFSGYFQIPIDPKDQEKTTFTCPYGTFAYRRMPFGLCNAPEIEACLTSKSIPPGIDDVDFDPKEDLLTLERLLNYDPSSTLPPEEQRFEDLKTVEPSSDELPELELKDLPPHLEYAFLEGTNKLPIIIAKDLKDEDKTALLKVLRSHKRAIWKMSDIKGIDLKFCTHKILMEDNVKPTMQHQRQVNPKIHEVIKKEVIKLLEAGLIDPISDSPWVSPVHCMPKKGGITVIENDNNELIPNRLITGWRVCIDYQKLNDATYKDHFALPFMDQMLERLSRNEYYCFLDGFSGYFQIPIDPKDQEKTTFTCPYRTFAYRRMPFGLCNAPSMFQRCMMAIFHDMIKETMEVFMDDLSVFGDSFSSCLSHLDKMHKRCKDTNLVLN